MKNKHWLIKKFEDMIGSGKRFKSRNEMSLFLGLTETTRTTFFNFLDGTQTKYTIVFEWIEKLSDGKEDFLTPIMRRLGANSPTQKVDGGDLREVPIMACAGAGPAVEDCSLEFVQTISVLEDYVHPGVFACKIVGDSMEPSIINGAYVGVVPLSENLVEGAIYLIWQPPFGLVAKRVYPGQDGTLILRSDNPAVKDVVIEAAAYENIIKGRVVWVWQNV